MLTSMVVLFYMQGPHSTDPLCQVQAKSEDPVTYSLEDLRYFSVNLTSGEVMQNVDLDYENPAEREFLVCIKCKNFADKAGEKKQNKTKQKNPLFHGHINLLSRVGRAGILFWFFVFSGSRNDPKNTKISKK